MSNPIPNRLLPHSATLYPYDKMVSGAPTYKTSAALTHVRFEVSKKNAMTALGESKNDKMRMFFDRVNSGPAGTKFALKDKIVFIDCDGVVWTLFVRESAPKCGSGGAWHHYEVDCV